ncbi:MAG: ABC transporter permease [Gammaproteobacteria bacterium]|nr:ABC transporter permease [Gammaproteobacteria bacterium]
MTWFSFQRVWAIARKEFSHLKRDRLTGGMVAGIPIVMTLLFGYAINNDVRGLSAAVVDEANTSASRALISDARATQVIDELIPASNPWEIQRQMARGRVSVGIYIPADFEERLARGQRPLAQILVDDSDPVILSAVRGMANLPVRSVNQADERQTFEVRALYNPERRSAVFIVPGLCGVILTLTMVLFTSTAIVRERERGNLELLIATPVKPIELMVGKITPYVVIGYAQVSLILVLGVWVFDVPIRGSLGDLYLGAGAFVASVLTLGLLISTIAETQFQAFQMTFMTFLPQLLLSGFMFPFEGMPRVVQWLAEIFPLTHFLRIVRGIVLKDASLSMLTAELWPLAAFFVVVMSLATIRFRKTLD